MSETTVDPIPHDCECDCETCAWPEHAAIATRCECDGCQGAREIIARIDRSTGCDDVATSIPMFRVGGW